MPMLNKGLDMRKFLYASLALLLLSGCATMEGVVSFRSGGDTENLHDKERRLWHEASGYDHTIRVSDQLYSNDNVTAYLQKVMDRLYPEFKGKINVQAYDSTSLNAFALPNGSIYFNIGLLARIENEAQLAAVLAHEAVHFIEKHSFKQRVSSINAAAFALSGIPFSNLAAVSSISGFSQDLEREADTIGYERLVKSGYNPKEAHKVFQHLADEVKTLGVEEPYFFSSHPKLIDRINEFKELSSKFKGKGRIGAKSYNKIIKSVRLDVLRKDIGQDRFKSVILVMENEHARRKYPSAGYYYLGEAYYRRDSKGDKKKALAAYKKAEKLSPKFAPTYQRLGLYYMKKGKKREARNYFRRYLKVARKDARDRAYVQQYLKSL